MTNTVWKRYLVIVVILSILLLVELDGLTKFRKSNLSKLSGTVDEVANRSEDVTLNEEEAEEEVTTMVHNNSIFTKPIVDQDFIINKRKRLYNSSICQLFDFAVTGFAKCGSTSVRYWIFHHKETRIPREELFYFYKNPIKAANRIQQLTNKLGPGAIQGYGNPHEIQRPGSLEFYTNTCPNTKLVVTMRHPILWFESFYNYRRVKGENWAIRGEPNDLIKRGYVTEGYTVNSASGAFHKWLAVLGKTELNKDELDLLNGWYNSTNEFRTSTSTLMKQLQNPIFIMDISQLDETNTTRLQQLNHDLQTFLGLSNPLPSALPNLRNSASEQMIRGNWNVSLTIDICSEELKPIHDEMALVARNASLWINKYFLESSDVSYSGNLKEIVEGWQIDPCIERRKMREGLV